MSDTLHTQQILDGDDVVALRRNQLCVEVVKGPDKKLRVTSERDALVVGTHSQCDVVLSDQTVSRQHCEIALVADGYRVRDLDSTNGTYLDRARVGEVVVDRKCEIRVGDTILRLTPTSDATDIPLSSTTQLGPLLGRSAAMRRVFEVLEKVSPTDATVLITGESGTGKELAARAIHERSARAKGPFVVVDCGALPANLIESALYGHERGAFTGAVSSHVGAFEAASGGTLFLDELGELPLDMQTRLLGALERRVVTPVGGSEQRDVNVRVVAATNRDLRREINRGTFREDLYFRLAVVSVHMPPLRDRRADIPLYVEAFIAEAREGGAHISVDADTLERLSEQSWPGNVRELRNVLERAAALGEVDVAPPEDTHLPAISGDVDIAVPFKTGKAALIESYERAYIEQLMKAHDQNITRAARSAEIDRVYLLRLLDKYGMRPAR